MGAIDLKPARTAAWHPSREEIWRAAVEGSGYGVWEWRAEAGTPLFSPRCREMLGYDQVPLADDAPAWLELIHPEDRDRAMLELGQALKGEIPHYRCEYRVRCADGSYKWILVRGAVIARSEDQRASHFVGTMVDVSERHSHMAALRRAEEQSAAALVNLASYLEAINQHALVSVTDTHGTILEVNDRFCEVSGHSADQLIGNNHRILNSGHHPRAFFKEMWSTIAAGQIWRGEICNRARNGRLYWVDSAIVPQLDEAGQPRRYISVRIEISERKENEQRIAFMAEHDALTGLPNRILLEDRIQNAIARARRRSEKFAVLFIDLDGFKDINDTLGHDVGDLLLRRVADRLKGELREEDTLARQGGDEFIALLTDLRAGEEAARVAEKLLHAVSSPFHLMRNSVHVGASIGVAIFPDDGEDAESLFKHGDIAMYQVKSSGRNGYRFFTPEMQLRVNQRQESRQLLYNALHAGKLAIGYQPVMETSSGQICAIEVQVSWSHPTLGPLQSDQLLDMAKDFGEAVELGIWTIREACRHLQEWTGEAGTALPRMIVNVSPRVLMQPGFLDTVLAALAQHAIHSRRLVFAIRHADLDLSACIQEQLSGLLNSGFGLQLNGFGAGHCNLFAVQALPLFAVRLDRNLSASLAANSQGRAVAKAMVDLIHALGFRAVVDAVDSLEQMAALSDLGVDAWQGSSAGALPATAAQLGKGQGRSNIPFFSRELSQASQDRMHLERELRQAIDLDQLALDYQPKCDLKTGAITGVEALLRWPHPVLGLIEPSRFIPIAEHAGLISALTEWVLDRACDRLRAWQQSGLVGISMAVNLSAHSLRSSDIVEQVATVLREYSLAPGELELEVTESAAMSDPEHCIAQLNALRALGVKLAIDDFGTGYSSLSYLKLLPADTLKLDRAFVKDIDADKNDLAICEAAISLAHKLGITVVAEGVETQSQRDLLARCQCDVLQGYFICEPLPEAPVLDFIRKWNRQEKRA